MSPQVLKCDPTSACPGRLSTDTTGFGRNCSEEYAGALCATCANNHFRDVGSSECVNCNSWYTGDLAINLVLLSLIIIIVGVQVYFTRQKLGEFIVRQRAKYLTLSNHLTMLCELGMRHEHSRTLSWLANTFYLPPPAPTPPPLPSTLFTFCSQPLTSPPYPQLFNGRSSPDSVQPPK